MEVIASSALQDQINVMFVDQIQPYHRQELANVMMASSSTVWQTVVSNAVTPVQRAHQPISVTHVHLASSWERLYAYSVLPTSTSKVILAPFAVITALSAPQVQTSALLVKHHTLFKTMENVSFVLMVSISTPPQELVSHAHPFATPVSHLMCVSRALMARS